MVRSYDKDRNEKPEGRRDYMKKKTGSMWGVILILFGIFIAGKSFGFFSFSLFFRGWWTLFIIIPSFIGLINSSKQNRSSNLIGLGIGFLLLLSSNGMFPSRLIFPLACAGFLIYTGMKFLKSDTKNQKESKTQYYTGDDWDQQTSFGAQTNNWNETYSEPYEEMNQGYDSGFQTGQQNYQTYQQEPFHQNQYTNTGYEGTSHNNNSSGRFAGSSILSGKTVKFDNQYISNGMFSCVLGGMDLDLRNAIIRDSVVIETKVLCGGIDILVPRDVRVVINCTPILGGVDDKTTSIPAGGFFPTIYINGTCVLGGIDVKYK